MTEKGPNFRIVGNIPPEQKEQEVERLKGFQREKHLQIPEDEQDESDREKIKELLGMEYPKTEQEKRVIKLANDATNQILQKYGLEPYDIPENNYHIVPPETYKLIRGEDGVAFAKQVEGLIVLNKAEMKIDSLLFAECLFHETLHMKSHLSVEIEHRRPSRVEEPETPNPKLRRIPYRLGLQVQSSQKQDDNDRMHKHFSGLNEAVIENHTLGFMDLVLEQPDFAEEKKWMESDEAKELKHQMAKDDNLKVEDIYYISKDGGTYWTIGYYLQHEVYDYACSEIQKQFPENYQTIQDVKDQFDIAFFNGKIMKLAHLVEGTFGQGSFRRLGDMTTQEESAITTMEALRKMRLNKLKAK
ncbi:MAG: hypothetical protein NTV62_01345 [Candidatus Gribaldobacteria bacterium]|nr:hypothetical protein [Candidatus Gribaldobacteria bacterium]